MSPFPQYYFPSSSSSTSPNYLLQPLPLSSSLPLPSLLVLNQLQDHHDATIFLPQNHPYPHDPTLLLPTPPLAAAAPPIPPKKPPAVAKKDRHRKIYTAQGLRDRRVRLSIDIAREFFDLHDMLGFDKASKTLEWLLAKSRKAIRELDHNHHPILTGSQEDEEDDDRLIKSASHVSLGGADEAAAVKAKESRAKARARARARTKEKRFKYYYSSHASSRGKISEAVVPIKTCSDRSQMEFFDVSSKGEISINNNNNSSNGIHSSSSSSSLLLPGNWDINCTALSPPPTDVIIR